MKYNEKKIKRYLAIGLLGAVITVIGEMSQGLAETIKSADAMTEMYLTYAALPGWRHGFGSTVGAIGILLQFFGVYAIYLSFTEKADKSSALFRISAVNYSFIGAIVHVLMATSVYIYKVNSELLKEYLLWFTLPILIIFFAGYIFFCVILFNKFRKGETIFPKWCCVLNPIAGKAVFHIVSLLIPSSVIANGIGYSNMGLTAIIIFGVLLLNVKSANRE